MIQFCFLHNFAHFYKDIFQFLLHNLTVHVLVIQLEQPLQFLLGWGGECWCWCLSLKAPSLPVPFMAMEKIHNISLGLTLPPPRGFSNISKTFFRRQSASYLTEVNEQFVNLNLVWRVETGDIPWEDSLYNISRLWLIEISRRKIHFKL